MPQPLDASFVHSCPIFYGVVNGVIDSSFPTEEGHAGIAQEVSAYINR